MTNDSVVGEKLLSDDFSDESLWPTDNQPGLAVRYREGRYEIEINESGSGAFGLRELDPLRTHYSIAVDAQRISEETGYFGVLCGQDTNNFYALLLGEGSAWIIARLLGGQFSLLAEGRHEAIPVALERPARITAACAGASAPEPGLLELFVDGQLIGQALDEQPPPLLPSIGLYGEKTEAASGFKAHFSDLEIRSPESYPDFQSRAGDYVEAIIPAGWPGQCLRLELPPLGAVVALECIESASERRLEYALYSSAGLLSQAHAAMREQAAVGEGSCSDGEPAEHEFRQAGVVSGRVVCGWAGDEAWLYWTDEVSLLAGRLSGELELAQLYELWHSQISAEGLPGPESPAPSPVEPTMDIPDPSPST